MSVFDKTLFFFPRNYNQLLNLQINLLLTWTQSFLLSGCT